MNANTFVNSAYEFCQENGYRLTDPRRFVLEIIVRAGKPLGAYDILAALGGKLDNPKPPTAYRAIEFWQSHGFIHKIESLNAFTLCHAGHQHQGSQYMICDSCGSVEEVHLCDLPGPLQSKAAGRDFAVRYWNAELHGRCADCA